MTRRHPVQRPAYSPAWPRAQRATVDNDIGNLGPGPRCDQRSTKEQTKLSEKEQKRRAESLRGIKEARERIAELQARWPIAFPPRSEDVRPLALGVVPIVAAETGWSWPYAKGVLRRWKEAPAYCRAVLSCPNRINLDGSEAGPVDDVARDHARSRLEKIRKGREERKLKEAQRAAEAALRFPLIEDAPAAAEPEPAEPPPPPVAPAEVERHETPKQMKMRLAAEAKAAKHAQKRALRAGAP